MMRGGGVREDADKIDEKGCDDWMYCKIQSV